MFWKEISLQIIAQHLKSHELFKTINCGSSVCSALPKITQRRGSFDAFNHYYSDFPSPLPLRGQEKQSHQKPQSETVQGDTWLLLVGGLVPVVH